MQNIKLKLGFTEELVGIKFNIMHKKNIENVLKLGHEERFEYFIRESVQSKKIWALSTEEGYITFTDKEGDTIMPVWPYEEFASRCRFKEHEELDAEPKSIEFDAFVKYCIPDMVKHKVQFGVFYNQERIGICVEGDVLTEELTAEYEEIWG